MNILIVAVNDHETKLLDALFKRAIENKVKDVCLLNQDEIKKLEPNICGIKAIWSPNTGIVDWAEVSRSFARDCEEKGADIYLNFDVHHFVPHSSSSDEFSIVVCGKGTDIFCKYVVTCGGLYSDKLAKLTGCSPEPKIIPFRGEYLVLKPEKTHLVNTNIYPVPYPELPFLGVHITPHIDGSVWLGPNALLALKMEGYRPLDFDIRDAIEILRFRGVRKLIWKHLSYGLNEIYRGINIGAQVRMLQKYLPELDSSHVIRGPTGVRAQAVDANGNLVDDFVFDVAHGEFAGKILHVRNAPSPAATSSLAIAKKVVDKIEENFNIKTL